MATWQQTSTASTVLALGLGAFWLTAGSGGVASAPLAGNPAFAPAPDAASLPPLERSDALRTAGPAVADRSQHPALEAASRIPAAPGGAGVAVADARTLLGIHADGAARALLLPAVVRDLGSGGFGIRATVELTSSRHVVQRVAEGRAAIGLIGRDLTGPESRLGIGVVDLGSFVPAFVAHPDNPVRNLRSAQLRPLLRGTVRDWSELGGEPGPILLITPADDENRALIARTLIPGDALAVTELVSEHDEQALALARSDRFALAVVALPVAELENVAPLTIDGVAPAAAARHRGTYPYGTVIRLVHGPVRDPAVRRAVERLRAADGPFARRLAR